VSSPSGPESSGLDRRAPGVCPPCAAGCGQVTSRGTPPRRRVRGRLRPPSEHSHDGRPGVHLSQGEWPGWGTRGNGAGQGRERVPCAVPVGGRSRREGAWPRRRGRPRRAARASMSGRAPEGMSTHHQRVIRANTDGYGIRCRYRTSAVRKNHAPDEFVEPYRRLPAQHRLGPRRVAPGVLRSTGRRKSVSSSTRCSQSVMPTAAKAASTNSRTLWLVPVAST